MLNADAVVTAPLNPIDYQDAVVATYMANGAMNVSNETVAANIRSAIRRGHPQVRPYPVRPERICLVGSGPSLNDTLDELREVAWSGAALCTLNGAYHWCRERNLRPQTQIVMDARPTNARFVTPHTPQCNYLLASQCAPAVWDAVEGYKHVRIFHAVIKDEGDTSAILDQYYGGAWVGVGGGTTVATRALHLLRMLGYVRFVLFGVDCCWMGTEHHALPQPENAREKSSVVRLSVTGSSDVQEFRCSAWHVKQFEDFLTTLKINGAHYTVDVRGNGMLATALRMLGDASLDELQVEKE